MLNVELIFKRLNPNWFKRLNTDRAQQTYAKVIRRLVPVQMTHIEVFTPRAILGIKKRLMKRHVSQQFIRAIPVFVCYL